MYVLAAMFMAVVSMVAFIPPANVPGGIVAGIVAVGLTGLAIWERTRRGEP